MSARLGVVGCGWWSTTAHLPGIAEHPDGEIAAIADPSEKNRAHAAGAFEVASTYGTAEEMLEAEELDAVVIGSPPVHHFEPAAAALRRGLNVLVEKPMVLRVEDGRELVRLAEENGCELAVGYTYHFSPHVGRLREAVAGGRIGEVEHVFCFFGSIVRDLYRGRPESLRKALGNPEVVPRSDTYSDPAVAGGGQVQAQLTHALALALHLTGLRVARVAAFLQSFELAVDLADAVSLSFTNGAVGSIGSTGGMVPGQEEILESRILGHGGHLLLDLTKGAASIHGTEGAVEELAPIRASRSGEEVDNLALYPEKAPVQNLIELTLGRAVNINPGTLGVHVVEVIEAIYESSRSERVVALPSAGA
jgi:predicted dehydrogenase